LILIVTVSSDPTLTNSSLSERNAHTIENEEEEERNVYSND